jgi:hypothetical protein
LVLVLLLFRILQSTAEALSTGASAAEQLERHEAVLLSGVARTLLLEG